MALTKSELKLLTDNMQFIKTDLQRDLKDINKNIRQDISDVNTTINVLAQDIGEVRGKLSAVARQVTGQSETIKDVVADQTKHNLEIDYLKKRLSRKSGSVIPKVFKKVSSNKIIIYALLGLLGIIGLAAYIIISHLFGQEIFSNLFGA